FPPRRSSALVALEVGRVDQRDAPPHDRRNLPADRRAGQRDDRIDLAVAEHRFEIVSEPIGLLAGIDDRQVDLSTVQAAVLVPEVAGQPRAGIGARPKQAHGTGGRRQQAYAKGLTAFTPGFGEQAPAEGFTERQARAPAIRSTTRIPSPWTSPMKMGSRRASKGSLRPSERTPANDASVRRGAAA